MKKCNTNHIHHWLRKPEPLDKIDPELHNLFVRVCNKNPENIKKYMVTDSNIYTPDDYSNIPAHIENERVFEISPTGKLVLPDGRRVNEVKITIPNNKLPGRNDPCHCGSGKKFKKCCGRNE